MKTTAEQNKRLVLKAFDTLFNKRDYVAAEKLWSPHYIQHSAHIAPGREGLFNLVKTLPATLRYESGTIVADGDLRDRPRTIFGLSAGELDRRRHFSHRGLLVEHWDVIQDEATEAQSKSNAPMFGTSFPR